MNTDFEYVALYLAGLYSMRRYDCRRLRFHWAPYAQHARALHLAYVLMGKKKWHREVLYPQSDAGIYAVAVSLRYAVAIDDPWQSLSVRQEELFPEQLDPDFRGDLDKRLAYDHVPILLDFRNALAAETEAEPA
jgi:hypothetical protein